MTDKSRFREIKTRAKRRLLAHIPHTARLPKFIGAANDAAAKFATLKAAIVGVGSVGGRAALHLGRVGIAELWLVDGKVFKRESLLTHESGPEDFGKSKATVMGERCQALSPFTRIHVFPGRVEQLPMDAFGDADVVVMATDNLAAELEVSRRCRQLGKPLIQAAVHGESLTAQVRTFGNAGDEGPCVGCGYSDEEWQQLTRQIQFSCESPLIGNSAPQISEMPTVSVSGLCSLAADLAFNQVLRLVLQLGAPVTNTILGYCGHTNRAVTSPLARNANCPCDHRRYALASPPKPLREISFGELATAAGFNNHAGVVTFALDGWDWARLGGCKCPAPRAVERFIASGQPHAGRCAKCRAPILVPPFFRHRPVSAWTLGEAMAEPLDTLGAGTASCVVVDDGQRAVLFRESKT